MRAFVRYMLLLVLAGVCTPPLAAAAQSTTPASAAADVSSATRAQALDRFRVIVIRDGLVLTPRSGEAKTIEISNGSVALDGTPVSGRELREVIDGRKTREQALRDYGDFNDSHEWKFRWMLRVQKLVPKIPPRLLGPLVRLLGSKRFIKWSFSHYLQIAPPEFAARSANDQNGAGKKQDDAEDALGAERDLVEAE